MERRTIKGIVRENFLELKDMRFKTGGSFPVQTRDSCHITRKIQNTSATVKILKAFRDQNTNK